MTDFLKTLENILIDLWNYLYMFLCYLSGVTPNPDDNWADKDE